MSGIKNTLNLDGLLQRTPEQFRPLVAKYGPGLVAMTAQEFCDWLELLIMGDQEAAWKALLAKMPNAALLDAWKEQAGQWADAADRNESRMALQKEATLAVLKVLLAGSLAWVGL